MTERFPGPGLDAQGLSEHGPDEQSRVKRSMREQTWAGAAGEVWRSALRHKFLSAIVALCVAGSLTAFAVASSASGASGAPDQARPAGHPAAAAFSLPALGQSGSPVSLRSYQGKPLIVNFFASWCDPCQRETPLLATFYRTELGKVAIVGLDENDVRANAMSFTHRYGVGYPVGFDPTATVATAYGVIALPQTFFLDARHHVVDRVFGAVTLADLSKGIALATGK
jgi:cytochrome c biogenesis protein CcmG/thiol:disulfide interchange protein DsbE